MFNIFLTIFFITLAAAFVEPYFFIGFLIGIAIIGLFQAIFMANAGGAWDNAKKIVETELQREGHRPARRHASSATPSATRSRTPARVAMNPIIKFATLFGLLAVELALRAPSTAPAPRSLGGVFFLIALVFVYRSFYGMRIKSGEPAGPKREREQTRVAPTGQASHAH